MSRARVAVVVVTLVLVALIQCGWGPPASAVGNAALNQYIVAHPVPGLVPLPASQVEPLVSKLGTEESVAAEGTGLTTTVAAEVWRRPGAATKNLLIGLIAISGAGQTAHLLDAAANEAAASGAASFCAGAAASLPAISRAVPNLPSSHIVVCKRSSNGAYAEAITTARANVLVIIGSSEETLDRAQITAIAFRQFRALPSGIVAFS